MRDSNRCAFGYLLLVGILVCGMHSEAGTVVRIGANNYLESDGRPVFPIGAYSLPKGYTYEQGREMGFNLLSCPANKDVWDSAHAAGLRIWHSFGSSFDFDQGDAEKKKASIRTVVTEFGGHPGLLHWESMDEPAWTDGEPAKARATAGGLAKGYRFLKSLDLNHPVYLNHAPRNTVDTLRRYNSGCDIVCADIYPIIPRMLRLPMFAITPDRRHGDLPNQTPSCTGEIVDKMREVANDNQAVFVVLQGFAWECLRSEDQRTEDILFPSYHEARFMAYNAIVHGANGLQYWGLSYVPENHAYLGDLARALNEIGEMSPAILGETLPHTPVLRYHERGSTIVAGVELLCKRTADTVYIIATNTGIDAATVDFAALPPEIGAVQELEVLGENRRVSLKDGAFTDDFAGLGVHLYACPYVE